MMALITLLLLYLIYNPANFAYTSEREKAVIQSPPSSSNRSKSHNKDDLIDEASSVNKVNQLNVDSDIGYEGEGKNIDPIRIKNGMYVGDKEILMMNMIYRRQPPASLFLTNNVMVPINLEMGQLFTFTFPKDALWANKSPVTSSFPSKIELFTNHEVSSNVPISKKKSNDSRFQDKSAVKDARIKSAQDVMGDKITSSATNIETENSNTRTLYISVTTCLQPRAISNFNQIPPPQLQLYVSQSNSNKIPGPAQLNDPNQEMLRLVNGYALHTIDISGDVYIGLYAENDYNYSGIYSAQIAASLDAPYHYHEDNSDSNLFVADSDANSALLYTDPFIHNGTNETLLREWAVSTPPFSLFVYDSSVAKNIIGLEYSFCGLEQNANIIAPNMLTEGAMSNIATYITTLGPSNLPRQQFYISGLKPSTTYMVALAMTGHELESKFIGGGGRVFQQFSFNTLSVGNCNLIYGLSFCDQVAYNVPSNSERFPNKELLASFYDNSTRAIYQNFKKVLAQVPCEITSSGQYSLARTCNDCAQAYKAWLCAVNIPRCTDISSPLAWLQPRAIDQTFPNGSSFDFSQIEDRKLTAVRFSRNARIDEIISPGPYKEVLPCQELCHTLVSSCPASIGFSCPQPGQIGFNTSYGQIPAGQADDQGRKVNITCNLPGMIYFSTANHWSPWKVFLQLIFIGVIALV